MFIVDFVVLAIFAIPVGAILGVAIASMAKKHSSEVYVIWYITSLFFVVFCILQVIALNRGVQLAEVCGGHRDDCKEIYGYLTNPLDELGWIVIGLTLVVVPQCLTYVLSGLSGSASSPRLISLAGKWAVWSLVKFLAALAGIEAAQLCGETAAGHPFEYSLLLWCLLAICYTFIIASAYLWFTERLPMTRRCKWFDRAIVAVHESFTRNARVQ